MDQSVRETLKKKVWS